MSRAHEVVELLRSTGEALDDDEIGRRLGINRHYVNALCRGLQQAGAAKRFVGSGGKLVTALSGNHAASMHAEKLEAPGLGPRPPAVSQHPAVSDARIDQLIADFARSVLHFESSNAFPGPSLYFHERAIERRRRHRTPDDLMADTLFLEYVYAVLPAWGMHRMGRQAAKVGEFGEFVTSIHEQLEPIRSLWGLDIRTLPAQETAEVADVIWGVVEALRVSTSRSRLVAGSKALHHMLPDLVPPIDRQYTFRFFTGQKAVSRGERTAFLDWFPHLAQVARMCRAEIGAAVARRGFMATGPAKVVDNAVIGFMQRQATSD